MKRDTVVIPAFEPDRELLKLLAKIQDKSDLQVILVDDGSGADYAAIFEAAEDCATVLTHTSNQGKGQALKTAFSYLKEQNYEGIVLTADSDGQHSLWDMLRVRKVSREHPDQFTLGVRSFTGKVPMRSRFGNSLTRLLFKLQTGKDVIDTQTGLRAFHSKYLDFMLKIPGQRYEYEMNMLLAATKELGVEQMPIETIYINDNAASHFRPVTDGLKIYAQLFKFALSSMSSFVVDYLVYALALIFLAAVPSGLRILLANSLARVTSSIFNFASNKKLVFHNEDSTLKTGTSYFSLAVFLFVLDTFLIQLLYSTFGINLFIVKILVGFLLFFLSWFVQKKIIFKERTHVI
ncbi:bifunctional glycosyltransferase family 2/GtrA family protein [Streptococcus massiliensis]|uniref:Dolichol-phosphate mannosyltransferase n=1 Tax=Streptococcus massiliensis TaxID=313439 RepID=A0A380L0I3_9STRE|nr:bifunctional glycosyltransferase family 2/GtrA family protein [Streptococcus massiliensis]SUN77406.1 dolichol-phosphate mannosyltransferase [Streptococcus massiliensis]